MNESKALRARAMSNERIAATAKAGGARGSPTIAPLWRVILTGWRALATLRPKGK